MPCPSVNSPCTLQCNLRVNIGLCLGCGRTIGEITQWMYMSDADREIAMEEAAARIKDTDWPYNVLKEE